RSQMSNATERSSLIALVNSLCSVLYDEEALLLRELHDGVHLAGDTSVMDYYDRLSLRRDKCFQLRFIQIRMIWLAIHKDYLRTSEHEGRSSRDKGETGNDDLITRLYIQEDCRHLQRIGAGVGEQALLIAITIFKKLLASTGKFPVAGDLAQAHGFLNVLQFVATEEGFVEWI